MSRRRRRRNPGLAIPIMAVAALGGAAFFLLRKPRLALTDGSGTFSTTPLLPPGAFTTVQGILPGDCILVVSGAAGFTVPGVPAGEATPFKVGAVSGAGGTTVLARSLDPRAPQDQAFTVPAGAIIGSGDCAVGFA